MGMVVIMAIMLILLHGSHQSPGQHNLRIVNSRTVEPLTHKSGSLTLTIDSPALFWCCRNPPPLLVPRLGALFPHLHPVVMVIMMMTMTMMMMMRIMTMTTVCANVTPPSHSGKFQRLDNTSARSTAPSSARL